MKDKSHLFQPKYTKEDMEYIKELKSKGKDRPDIFYEMLKRRPDVSPISIGRWIDSVKG